MDEGKKRLKISNGQLEAVNRMTDNTTTNRKKAKKTNKGPQNITQKSKH